MYNHLSGKLIEKFPTHAIIECAGIGFFVNISLNTYSKINDSENCRLLIHQAIKEDAHLLYGFAEEEERKIFRHLISVSGIGESTARMMLSSITPNDIQQAILTGNVALLQSIKGIGAKTAQRAILDLQDKMKKGDLTSGSLQSILNKENPVKDKASSALAVLGFQKQAIEKVLNTSIHQRPEASVEELIRMALNQL